MNKTYCIVLAAALVLTACSDADMAGINAWGKPHHIKQFSGSKLIGEWCSTGKINNESESDGYYFEDAKTHQMVSISGHVQIFLGCGMKADQVPIQDTIGG